MILWPFLALLIAILFMLSECGAFKTRVYLGAARFVIRGVDDRLVDEERYAIRRTMMRMIKSVMIGGGVVIGVGLGVALILSWELLGASSAAEAHMAHEFGMGQSVIGGSGEIVYRLGGQRGIWVTGSAVISVEPDVATLNVGVCAGGATVSEANAEGVSAMTAALAALRGVGVLDEDIQTRDFNVLPRYEYREMHENGVKVRRQVLMGYAVNNSVVAKIRDIGAVGAAIDGVVAAAGDNARINGVRFGVDDPDALRPELRRMAVQDAIAKAETLAELSGVELGRLLYMGEGAALASGGTGRGLADAYTLAAEHAAPPISAGESEVRFNISAGFEIQ